MYFGRLVTTVKDFSDDVVLFIKMFFQIYFFFAHKFQVV